MFESRSGSKVQLRGRGGRVGAAAAVAGLLAAGLVLVPGAATGQDVTPAQPTGLTATPTDNSVTVTWTPAATQTAGCAHKRYEVDLRFQNPISGITSNFGRTHIVAPPGPYTVTITGLTSGTSYDVKLDIIGTCGAWADSVYKTFKTTGVAGTPPSTTTTTTTLDLSVPPSPTGLSIASSGTQVVISWTPGTTATNCAHKRYEVEVTPAGDISNIIGGIKTVTPPGPYTVTVTGLTSGNMYKAKLDVVGDCGRWASSLEQQFLQGVVPLKLSQFSARVVGKQVVLSWESPNNYLITGYELRQRVGTAAWGAWKAISTVPATPYSGNLPLSHTVSGLEVGPTYFFQVRAVNSVGKGPESDTVEARSNILPARTDLPGEVVPETWLVKFRSAALTVPGVYSVGWSTVGGCDPSKRSATSLGAVTTDPGVGVRSVVVDVPEGTPDSATVSSPGVRSGGFEVDVSAATHCAYEFSVLYESTLSGDAGKGCTVRVTGVGKSGDESSFRVSYSARTAGGVYNLVVDTSDCAEMATIRVTLGPTPSASGPVSFRDLDGSYLDSDPTVGAILARAFKVTATPTGDSGEGCRAVSAHTRVDRNGTFTRNDDQAFAHLRVVKEASPSGPACHYDIATGLPAGFVAAGAGSTQSRVESYVLSPATKLVADGSDSGTAPDVVSTTAADCGESVTTGLGADNRLGSSDDTKASVSGPLCLTHSVKVAAKDMHVTQNVTGDPAGGTARYTLTASKACSGQAAPKVSTVGLHEDNVFSATSYALNYNAEPCLVTVAVSHLPAGCTTNKAMQTLNLTTADADRVNVSFDIACPTASGADMGEDMLMGPPEDIPTS